MTNRQISHVFLVLCSIFAVGLAGCSSPKTDNEVRLRATIAVLETKTSATSTPRPVPRATLDEEVKDSGREEEVATVSVWATPIGTTAPAISGIINGKKIHLRQAPSLDYEKWVHVPFGTKFPVVSRTPDGQWVQVCCVEGMMGWVRTKYIDLSNSNWTSIPPTRNSEESTSACPNGCTTHVQGCDVKGNVSFNGGERIYHLPGDKYYKETNISPRYGERWFCTRAEAEANGWRHARR